MWFQEELCQVEEKLDMCRFITESQSLNSCRHVFATVAQE